MIVSSFDIFDSCLVRKCGAPENVFDILSFRAFNGEVEESVRQEFVAARLIAGKKTNSSSTLHDIWHAFSWTHPLLRNKSELCKMEEDLEHEMLVPVLSMRDKVNECRKLGGKIIYISDMYLSSDFLIDVMRRNGFYQEGDSLYVSCECEAEKKTGELFRYVKEKEQITSFRNWHHYGDNKHGDYNVPKNLGIKCTLINHVYTPYQQQWTNNDYSLGFKFPSVLAGLGRALHYGTEWNSHTDFVLDLIAPFYCSLVFRMMKDAEQRGIKRLYFCARDAYMMYLIAQKYAHLFPTIECQFLYISRQALYNGDDKAKIAYYQSIGLASQKDYVGIVDIRSSGRTLVFLNNFLSDNGYRPVRGYYYELFCNAADINEEYFPTDYYLELSDRYDVEKARMIGSISHVFETFFPLNTLSKTRNYEITTEGPKPVFELSEQNNSEQMYVENKAHWAVIHEQLILLFTNAYIQSGLYKYSNDIFEIANQTLFDFIKEPKKEYLSALLCLYGKRCDSKFVPYIRRESWIKLLLTRGKDSWWKQGTIIFNDFQWFQKLYQKIRYE